VGIVKSMIQVDSEVGVKLGVWYGNRPILSIGITAQLTLNQRATGSTPVRRTNYINDLGRSGPDPISHKTCFRSVSENWAAALSCISTAGFEFFDHSGLEIPLPKACFRVCGVTSEAVEP
jgi:hypothetical protein